MGLRKGVFMGCYAPPEMKQELQEKAAKEHRTLSQEIVKRLKEHLQIEAGREQQKEAR